MAATDKLFAGSIPEIYERYFVPLIFAVYARDLAERIARVEPQNLLETAAGTGVLTRAIAARLPAHARIVATDLNQPMLDHAATKQSQPDRVTWRQADALALPFEDKTFDVVACQFGAMFFPDKVAAYREARRVLKPRGHFFFNVWDKISDNEFADVVTRSAGDGLSARPASIHGPHPARLSRRRKNSRGADRRGLYRRVNRYRRAQKQGRIAERSGHCVLSRIAAQERNRGARCIAPSRGDEGRG